MNQTQNCDRGLLLIVFCLLGFGLVMVFNTSSGPSGDPRTFPKHLLFLGIGLAGMTIASRLDYRRYSRPGILIPLLVLTIALLAGALLSPPVNNAHRWFLLGPFRGQPSELAKLTMILFTSAYLVRWSRQLNDLRRGLLPYLLVLGTVAGLVVIEPDLGTTACIVATSVFLLYLGGIHYRYLLALFLAGSAAVCLRVLTSTYQKARILAFLNPDLDPHGIGYQIRQSLIAVGSGGFSGVGIANSRQKLDYLPESETDFVFAIVGEEMGLIGCLLLLILFLLLFRKGVQIALRADTPQGTLIGLGIVAMITLQALINMSVVVALVPTKGIPLPFVSVGGSSLLVTLAAVGILLNISRQARDPAEPAWFKRPEKTDEREAHG